MTPRRPRRLSAAEIEIWLEVARSVVPRPGVVLPKAAARRRPPEPPPAPPPAAPDDRRVPPVLPSYVPPVSRPRGAGAPPLVPFEKRLRGRIARGGVAIEGVMDLHGLTQAQAHDSLRGFLRGAQRDGSRLVLVVTGKGRSRAVLPDAESGVLRRLVPHWLRAPDLRAVVLGFEEAGLPHGGMGALYVRLRRHDG